jgi:hypothetical protein
MEKLLNGELRNVHYSPHIPQDDDIRGAKTDGTCSTCGRNENTELYSENLKVKGQLGRSIRRKERDIKLYLEGIENSIEQSRS